MNTILEIKDLVIHYETDDGCEIGRASCRERV